MHEKQGEQLQAESVSVARQTNSKAMDGMQHWRSKLQELRLCVAVCIVCCTTDGGASCPAQDSNTGQAVTPSELLSPSISLVYIISKLFQTCGRLHAAIASAQRAAG
jgi:sulfur relay (sulfurtransferase) complex TusBCD TusD component (DsrE family)